MQAAIVSKLSQPRVPIIQTDFWLSNGQMMRLQRKAEESATETFSVAVMNVRLAKNRIRSELKFQKFLLVPTAT